MYIQWFYECYQCGKNEKKKVKMKMQLIVRKFTTCSVNCILELSENISNSLCFSTPIFRLVEYVTMTGQTVKQSDEMEQEWRMLILFFMCLLTCLTLNVLLVVQR